MLELLASPTVSQVLEYRYYTRPVRLVYDNQTSQIPEAYEDLLEFKTLLLLPGFTRATEQELDIWTREANALEQQMKQNYQHGRTLGARARRVRMVPRY